MKKLMGMLLGLSLILGSASFAFAADDKKDDTKKEKKTKKAKKKKADMDKKS